MVDKFVVYSKLDAFDCFKNYCSHLETAQIMVVSDANATDSAILACAVQGDLMTAPEEWICQKSNTFSCKRLASHGYESEEDKKKTMGNWNIYGYEIEYCIVSYGSTHDFCTVVYSSQIMIGNSIHACF